MKHDKRVKKQNTPKGFHLYIEGPGRVDDSKSIDLSEEVTPDMMIDTPKTYTQEELDRIVNERTALQPCSLSPRKNWRKWNAAKSLNKSRVTVKTKSKRTAV